MLFSMISFFRFVMVMISSFRSYLFDNLTERGAMQLAFRTPTLTPTRTPTWVIRGCFSLFVIVRKPLKNLRFWLPLIQENRPIFTSSPVATTNPKKSWKIKAFSFFLSPAEGAFYRADRVYFSMWTSWTTIPFTRVDVNECLASMWTACWFRCERVPCSMWTVCRTGTLPIR